MSSNKVRYFLHDECGVKVGEVILPSYDYSTVIIEYEGICYRPIHYNISLKSALCYPVKKIVVEGKDENTRFERQSAFVG